MQQWSIEHNNSNDLIAGEFKGAVVKTLPTKAKELQKGCWIYLQHPRLMMSNPPRYRYILSSVSHKVKDEHGL